MFQRLHPGSRVVQLGIALFFASAPLACQGQSLNDFDVSNASIPVEKIFRGGPPRDGIPSIDNPKFVPVGKVDYLRDDDIVIGLERDSDARAYPLRILVWHEIVNDVIGDEPVTVTYCPLCGTSMVFDARVDDMRRTFGVSGLLYNSDVLMYDHETESLWSQIGMKAISGPDVGKELVWLPSGHMTWKAWREKHPQGHVLSTDTGHDRNYGGDAYAGYFASEATMFPVPHTRRELPNKEWVLGLIIDGEAKAYPVDKLPDGKPVADSVGGNEIKVHWDAASRHPEVLDADGRDIPSVMIFWFAWQAFYPETGLWQR